MHIVKNFNVQQKQKARDIQKLFYEQNQKIYIHQFCHD